MPKNECEENTRGYVIKNTKKARKILRRFVTKKSKNEPTQGCHNICGNQAECKKIIQKNTTKYIRKKCHPEFSICYHHLLFFTELQTTTGSLKRLFNWSFQFTHIEHVTFAFWNVTDMSEKFQEIFRRNVKQNARECQKEFQKGCQKKRQTEFQEQCQKGSQREFPKQSRKLVKNKSEQNTSNQFLKWIFLKRKLYIKQI